MGCRHLFSAAAFHLKKSSHTLSIILEVLIKAYVALTPIFNSMEISSLRSDHGIDDRITIVIKVTHETLGANRRTDCNGYDYQNDVCSSLEVNKLERVELAKNPYQTL